MEALVREMQDPEAGVPVGSQKVFLTHVPAAFMGEPTHIPQPFSLGQGFATGGTRPI